MKRWTIILLVAGLATACAPASQRSGNWDRPGGFDQAALAQDQTECGNRAEQETARQMAGMKGEPAYTEAKRKAIFRCMEEKGWVWKEKQVQPAPTRRYGY
jgi:hypothetical protein